MGKSNKRGGKKAHNKRLQNRRKKIEDAKNSMNNRIAKMMKKAEKEKENVIATPFQEKINTIYNG